MIVIFFKFILFFDVVNAIFPFCDEVICKLPYMHADMVDDQFF